MKQINHLYAVNYVRRVIANQQIEEPNPDKAEWHAEALQSLYEAHQTGGPKAAMQAWAATIRKLRPELARQYDLLKHVYTVPQLSQIPKMAYMLDDYAIYEGASNLLVGPRGTGKSFFAIDVACRAAQNRRVLYIAAEGAGVYESRTRAWYDYHGAEPSGNLYFYGYPVNTGDREKYKTFVEGVVKAIEPEVVIIDTVARCMVGMDENSSTDMKTFVARWDYLRERGATLLFVHHANRVGRQRGSGVLDDAADSVLFLRRLDGAISVRNDYEGGGKNKGAVEASPLYFRIKPHEVEEYNGENAAAVLEKVKRQDIDLGEVGKLNERQLRLLRTVEGVDEGFSGPEIVNALEDVSQATVYRQLKQLAKAGYMAKNAGMYTLTDKGQIAIDSNGGGESDG